MHPPRAATRPRTRTRDNLLIAILAAAAFLPYLHRPDIVTSHEARLIQVSRAMAQSGWPWNATPTSVPDVQLIRDDQGVLDLKPKPNTPPLQINPWLVPILNNQIRLQKPPLPYWCTAALYRVAGHWSESLSRAIPAMLGFLSTFLIAALARQLIGRRAALPAALVWVSSYFIPDEYRKAMSDPYLAFFTLLALWAWIRGTRTTLLIAYISTALGVLSKGHPLIPHLIIPIVLYHALHRRRVPGPWWLHLIGSAILIAITLPWPLYVLKYVPSAPEFWRYESTGRLSDNIEQYRPWHFYLPLLLQIALPWSALWLIGFFITRHRREMLPMLWLAAVVIFFSIFKHKKLSYLLPAIPAVVLMITHALLGLLAQVRKQGHKSPAAYILAAHTLVILAFAAFLLYLKLWPAIVPLLIALMTFPLLNRRRPKEAFALTAAAATLSLMLFFTFYRAAQENRRSPKPAAAALLQTLQSDPRGATLLEELPPETTVYLPLNLHPNPSASRIYLLIDDKYNKIQPTLDYAKRKLPHHPITAVSELPLPRQPKPRWKLFAFHTTDN